MAYKGSHLFSNGIQGIYSNVFGDPINAGGAPWNGQGQPCSSPRKAPDDHLSGRPVARRSEPGNKLSSFRGGRKGIDL